MTRKEKHMAETLDFAQKLALQAIGGDVHEWPSQSIDTLARQSMLAALLFNQMATAVYFAETEDWTCLEEDKETKDGQALPE
jgi:hypothetical protein